MRELPYPYRRIGLATTLLILFASASCTDNQKTSGHAVATVSESAPVVAPAGGLIGGHDNRTQQILGGGIGAIAGAAVSGYVDRLERDMRLKTAGTGIDLQRRGNELLLVMPSRIAFDGNAPAIRPGIRTTLDQVARVLGQYSQGFVDVSGYADAAGDEAGGRALAQSQAQSVGAYLQLRGVQPARIATQGYNRSATENAAASQHVEIKLVPLTDADLPPPPPATPAAAR